MFICSIIINNSFLIETFINLMFSKNNNVNNFIIRIPSYFIATKSQTLNASKF